MATVISGRKQQRHWSFRKTVYGVARPAMPAEALHLDVVLNYVVLNYVVLNLCHNYTIFSIVVTRHSESTHLVAR